MAVMAVMAVCIAIAVPAGCGGGSDDGSGDQNSQEPARLGCGEFCRQAGGVGDRFIGRRMLTIDVGESVEALPDGAVPVAMTCRFTAPCEGALLLNSDATPYPRVEGGRSDLLVDAGGSRTIAVPFTDVERERLARDGRLETAITALLTPTWLTLPASERENWRPVGSAVTMVLAPEP